MARVFNDVRKKMVWFERVARGLHPFVCIHTSQRSSSTPTALRHIARGCRRSCDLRTFAAGYPGVRVRRKNHPTPTGLRRGRRLDCHRLFCPRTHRKPGRAFLLFFSLMEAGGIESPWPTLVSIHPSAHFAGLRRPSPASDAGRWRFPNGVGRFFGGQKRTGDRGDRPSPARTSRRR